MFEILKLLMVQVAASLASFLDFLRLGSQSNWWGLACPSHCGPPSFISLCSVFLAGLGFGFGLAIILAFFLASRFAISPPPSSQEDLNPASELVVSRLRGYLHARPRGPRST